MSVRKLTDQIKEVSQQLMVARQIGDVEQIEELEDRLYTLEEDLEFEIKQEYDDKHSRDFV